jgi:dihydroorotate dehydrogenase (fumarate)
MSLTTNYLGLPLKNPIVASSSPLSHNVDSIRRLEDAGAAAVVLASLFEEQITFDSFYLDYYLNRGSESYPESLSYFPQLQEYGGWADEYMSLITRAKAAVDIPIIGSLNGSSPGGWSGYAAAMELAGADAIEINLYYIPTSADMEGWEIEKHYFDVLANVRQSVRVPVALKLSPYFSSTANMAARFANAGANGLVLFNRFYQPDIDLETLEVVPRLVLSNSNELRLPLRWVAILYGRVAADLAITTGIHSGEDVLKSLMAGAKVTMMASELLRNGLKRIKEILQEVTEWMDTHEYESVAQMIGSLSQQHCPDPTAFERANYLKTLGSYQPVN